MIEINGIEHFSVTEISKATRITINKMHHLMRKDSKRKQKGEVPIIPKPKMIAGVNYWPNDQMDKVILAIRLEYGEGDKLLQQDSKPSNKSVRFNKKDIMDRVFRGSPDPVCVQGHFRKKFPRER